MTDVLPYSIEQHPYGSSTPSTKNRDDRYNRHRDWIETTVLNWCGILSAKHIRTCEGCGAYVSLKANSVRRHLATKKHLKSVGLWTELDETESNALKEQLALKNKKRN
jgi:hypothetical protein